MGLKKGMTNNRAGRPKGALNKLTKGLQENITDFLTDNLEQVLTEWGATKGRDKLQFYRDLLQYAIPKKQAMNLDIDFNKMSDEQLDEIIETLKDKIR